MAEREALLTLTDLHVRFAEAHQDAVSGVSFHVAPGEIVAVVGESGSGKSVTALSVLGLLPATASISGSVKYRDEELVDASLSQLRSIRGARIAMVFQEPQAALDPVFTIGFQLDEVLARHEPSLSRAARAERAVSLLKTVGIHDPQQRLRSFPHQFSGGQLQRIMLALSLAAGPDLLLADEPTTALDVTVQQEILNLLRRLNAELGMAVLIITHDMGVVADIAQRVIVMRNGTVVEEAEVHQLFAHPGTDYTRELLRAVPRGNGHTPDVASDTRKVLEVQDLRINYRTRFARTPDVVKGVSFSISAGEVLGLVGESGSGKSSIGRSLLGLAPLTSGQVLIEGEDLASLPSATQRKRRAGIGVIFQSPSGSLNPRLSIGEAIAEPLRTAGGFSRPQVQERVAELLDQVGIASAWHERYPYQLSGGQKQRVGIARALALSPHLLIADEPTSALDVSVQADVLDLLRRLQRELQFACLFISHDLFVVQNLCENVLVLRDGEVVESGPTSQVLQHPAHPYTRKLVLSAPVPDPVEQAARRALAAIA